LSSKSGVVLIQQTVLKTRRQPLQWATRKKRIVAMNDDTRDLDTRDFDRADTQILIPELPDEVLEVAAGIGGTIPTGSVNLIPPNCC
jgi:hypothetical protein